MVSEGSANSRHSLPLLLALTCAGLAGNYFNYSVVLNIDFLFGSIFAMLALQYFGPVRGLLAALIISSYTYFLFSHPYHIVIASAEMAVVGWLFTRRKMGLVLADTLYWVCLGMPLAFLFHHVVMHSSDSNVHILMVKQALNGIANALTARLLFIGYAHKARRLTISFREAMSTLLALFVLYPALILLAVGSRGDFAETDRGIRSALLRDSHRVTTNLDHWITARKAVLAHLARLAATLPPSQMQSRLEQAKASDLYLQRVGLHDKDAVITAYTPLTDELGHNNLGKDFSDRPFIPELKRTLKPLLSEMSLSRIGAPKPRVMMVAPVVVNGGYSGFVAGILNLDRVLDILDTSADSQSMLYTLLDKNGTIIVTNHKDLKPMTPLVRGAGELRQTEEGVSQWVPALSPSTPPGERWKKSVYLKQSSVGDSAEWSLVLEQPVEPYQKILNDSYAEKLGLLFLILGGALAVAELLSRRIEGSILTLSETTSDLPGKLERGRQVAWPDCPVLEIRELVDNFREMTSSLTSRMVEIGELNETLERRVARRTEELGSLNRDFVNFLENTSDFIYFKDENSRFRFCSQTLAQITGHASWRDLIGKHDGEVFPADTARYYIEEEVPIFRDGSSLLNKINPYYDSQGKQGWVSTNKWPLFDEAGKVMGIFGISRDITEMMRMQESLRLARQSLDQVPDVILWIDGEGRVVDCNLGACRSLGYSQQELLESTIFAIDPMTRAEQWAETFAEMKARRATHIESIMLTKEGRSIPMDIQVTHIAFGDKEFLCGVSRDITERKSMEERLRRSEASLSRAHAIAKLGSWEWDPATGEVLYSDEIFDIFGIDRGSSAGKLSSQVEAMIHPEDRELVEAGLRARQTGVGQTVEYRIIRPDGSIRWIRAIGEFVREPGKAVRMIGASQDITEHKLMEEERLNLERQMLHLQKLESLGTLSGGIAHDFNNLLQVVLGNLDLTLMLLPEKAEVRKNLEQAVIATVRASELSGMMLAYSGKGVLAVKELNLSDLVRENSPVLAAVVSRSVSFTPVLAPDLPPVQADATQLLQVVMNLVKNSSEAIGEGSGSIMLATGVRQFDQASLKESRLEEKLAAGRYVWMEVSDTGCGMDEATKYKVFDPFFSTKFTGRGLGMSAALGIMRAHKGAIMLESHPGAGTKVRLLFPITPDHSELPLTLPPLAKEPGAVGDQRQDTVLIVDDEEMIRTLSVAMLEAFGFDTLVANDGEKALEIFRREADRISLVLLDQSMPIMDGLAVLKELRRIRPEVRVLLASGFSKQEVSARFKGLGLNGFIQKPFTVKCLSDEVRRVLQEP